MAKTGHYLSLELIKSRSNIYAGESWSSGDLSKPEVSPVPEREGNIKSVPVKNEHVSAAKAVIPINPIQNFNVIIPSAAEKGAEHLW